MDTTAHIVWMMVHTRLNPEEVSHMIKWYHPEISVRYVAPHTNLLFEVLELLINTPCVYVLQKWTSLHLHAGPLPAVPVLRTSEATSARPPATQSPQGAAAHSSRSWISPPGQGPGADLPSIWQPAALPLSAGALHAGDMDVAVRPGEANFNNCFRFIIRDHCNKKIHSKNLIVQHIFTSSFPLRCLCPQGLMHWI